MRLTNLVASQAYGIKESVLPSPSLQGKTVNCRSCTDVLMHHRYLFNPLTILTCLGRPSSVFTTYFIVLAIAKACTGAVIGCTFALALASYMSLHPGLLAPPLALLCYDRIVMRTPASHEKPSLVAFSVQFTLAFSAFIAALLALSFFLVKDWSFIRAVYGTRLLFSDLTPNVGLWWYFFIEMFDSFRSFFLGVFWIHMASYSPVLSIRFRKQPLAAVILMCGIFVIFQPYANVGDAGAFMAMLTLYSHKHAVVCYTAWSGILLSMDLRRQWQCQFFLCHHIGVEPRYGRCHFGHALGHPERRRRSRAARAERPGGYPDIV